MKLPAVSSVELSRDVQATKTRKASPRSRPWVCFICSWFSKWLSRVNPKLHNYVLKMKRMRWECFPKNMLAIDLNWGGGVGGEEELEAKTGIWKELRDDGNEAGRGPFLLPVWKLLHQPNMKPLKLGAESEGKRHLRFWQRNDWHKEMMVWGRWRSLLSDSRNSLQWQQEAEFQKPEGSRIMFLCTSKCYICDQGKKHWRKQYERMM